MLASQRVKDSEGNTVGFVVNGTFYTEDYILENIRYIENLSVTETGVISPEKELPEISYKEGIIEKLYRQKVQENPFVRDIQRQLSLWKKDPLHRVLQLEGLPTDWKDNRASEICVRKLRICNLRQYGFRCI